MKYTRYNMKRRRNKGLIFFVIAIVALILIIVGVNVKKIKNNNKEVSEISIIKPEKQKGKTSCFYFIQCGVFSNKENAETSKKTVESYGNPFVIEKDKKFKVILGIYDKKSLPNTLKILSDNGIQNTKITIKIVEDSLCNKEISEIINANLEILDKLSDKKVKAVKTVELKKWTNNLKKVDTKSKNIKVILTLKDYINKMPDEVKKEHVKDAYIFIYGCINAIQ